MLHPNVWARHGALQVRAWLAPALDAGLTLVSPEDEWRAAIVAADVVLSDHGSLTCYAVASGVPVIMAADGGPEVVPGSPIDGLRERLPALRRDQPVHQQVDAAVDVAGEYTPDLADTIFAHRGGSADLLRAAVYEQLRLPPPPRPVRVHSVPVPELSRREPTVLAVRTTMAGPVDDRVSLTLHRFPAIDDIVDVRPAAHHLAADESEPDPGWVERAAVVWRDDPSPSVAATGTWVATTLDRFPGARIAVAATVAGDTVAMVRGGRELIVSGPALPAVVGSALHGCLVHEVDLDRPRWLDIAAGAASATVLVTPRGRR